MLNRNVHAVVTVMDDSSTTWLKKVTVIVNVKLRSQLDSGPKTTCPEVSALNSVVPSDLKEMDVKNGIPVLMGM